MTSGRAIPREVVAPPGDTTLVHTGRLGISTAPVEEYLPSGRRSGRVGARPRISVIVIVERHGPELDDRIDALASACDGANAELILVIGASGQHALPGETARWPGSVVVADRPGSHVELRRLGLSRARGDVILLTSDAPADVDRILARLHDELPLEPLRLHEPSDAATMPRVRPRETGEGKVRPLRDFAAPLRICMVTTFYPPFNFGGDGIAIQRLSRALVRLGHHVTVVHDADAYLALAKEEPAPSRSDDGVTVVALRSTLGAASPFLTHQLGRPVIHGRQLHEILGRRTDVTFFHNVSLVGGPAMLSQGRGVTLYEAHEHWLVCPTHVLWRHGRERCDARECLRCVVAHRRPPQVWRWTGQLDRHINGVDAFIAKSAFSREKHREFGFKRDMEVIPYFLPDLGPTPTSVEPSAPRPHERPYFLFVGRLERIKGLDDVIPAFAGADGPDLLIAGDGQHGPALRALAAGSPRVRFLGRVPPDELARYYAHAVALIVPSVCYETFGIILIEAFRQGTPVIARRLGPFPEIVEAAGGGLLFDTAEELTEAMRTMLHDRARRDGFAASAQRAFRERWSESVVVPQYLRLIRRVALAKADYALVDALSGATCT